MKNAFCYLLRVRYAECDAQKVVFNAKYVEYIDVAATEFIRALFGSYNNLLAVGIDTQVVNVTVNWKAPAFFDEVLAVTIHTKRIGTTSYTLAIGFYNYEEQREIATAEITYVIVDAKKHTKMAVADDMRATLEKGAPDVVVNHADVEVVKS